MYTAGEVEYIGQLEREAMVDLLGIVSLAGYDRINRNSGVQIIPIDPDQSSHEEPAIGGFRVIGPARALARADADAMKALVLDPYSNDRIRIRRNRDASEEGRDGDGYYVKMCIFSPGWVVRFQHQDGDVDCLVCFECSEWQFLVDGERCGRAGYIDGISDTLDALIKTVYPTRPSASDATGD